MKGVKESPRFREWFAGLRDLAARYRIEARIRRLVMGNAGSHRVLSRGLCELKVDVGPGYRVYYTRQGEEIVLLLAGGDKSTQREDIQFALKLIEDLRS
jgi:putative addiction module killer protein